MPKLHHFDVYDRFGENHFIHAERPRRDGRLLRFAAHGKTVAEFADPASWRIVTEKPREPEKPERKYVATILEGSELAILCRGGSLLNHGTFDPSEHDMPVFDNPAGAAEFALQQGYDSFMVQPIERLGDSVYFKRAMEPRCLA